MKHELVVELRKRNARIIDAIIKKAYAVCPGSIALIGIAGSFCSGDIHGRSDLDLCIVINDDDGWKIASCFILNEVGFDIYCSPWHKLEAMAEYTHPYVVKLLELDIVYAAGEPYLERYMALRKKIQDKLNSPFSIEDAKNVTTHFENAMKAYTTVMLSDNSAECKYASAKMLVSLEYVIFLANKSYIKRGTRRIPAEIRALSRLPTNFLDDYQKLITARALKDIQSCATRIMQTTRAFVMAINESVATKKDITRDYLAGTYEEIFSNWRNKMHLAARTGDAYLASWRWQAVRSSMMSLQPNTMLIECDSLKGSKLTICLDLLSYLMPAWSSIDVCIARLANLSGLIQISKHSKRTIWSVNEQPE